MSVSIDLVDLKERWVGAKENLPQDALHPRDNLVGRRVGGLVQVDDTGADVGLEVTLQRRSTGRDRSEVTGANEHCKKGPRSVLHGQGQFFFLSLEKSFTRTLLVVLEQERPVLAGQGRVNRLGLDGVVHLHVVDGGHSGG